VIRLLAAAPSAMARAGLESLAAAAPDVEVVGAASLADLNAALDRWQPDVVLAAMDGHSDEAPEELMALAARDGAPAIVVLAADLQPQWAGEALRAGIRAVLPGDLGPREIRAAVAAAAAGLVVMHPQDLPVLAAERPLPVLQSQTLSPREIEVLGMLAEGHGNKTIAWKLGISEHTVKFHVASILSKLNAGTRTEAVTQGIRRGLILI
jgi:NarL family two-component system response regulator YdfI